MKGELKTDVLCPEVMVTPTDSLSPGQQGSSAQILQEPAARHWRVVLGPLLPETSPQCRHRRVLVRNLGVVVAPFSPPTNSLHGLILPPLTGPGPYSHCGLPGPGQQPQPRLCSLPPVCSLLCSRVLSNSQSTVLPSLSALQGGPPLTGQSAGWPSGPFKTQHTPGICPAPDLTIFLPPQTLGSVLQPHPHPRCE